MEGQNLKLTGLNSIESVSKLEKHETSEIEGEKDHNFYIVYGSIREKDIKQGRINIMGRLFNRYVQLILLTLCIIHAI